MAKPSPEDFKFTENTQALAAILERFRQETLPLEESLTLFDEGVQRIKACQASLNQARGRFLTIQEALLEAQSTNPLD